MGLNFGSLWCTGVVMCLGVFRRSSGVSWWLLGVFCKFGKNLEEVFLLCRDGLKSVLVWWDDSAPFISDNHNWSDNIAPPPRVS